MAHREWPGRMQCAGLKCRQTRGATCPRVHDWILRSSTPALQKYIFMRTHDAVTFALGEISSGLAPAPPSVPTQQLVHQLAPTSVQQGRPGPWHRLLPRRLWSGSTQG